LLDYVRGSIKLDEVSRVFVKDDPILFRIAQEWATETNTAPLGLKIMVITTDDASLCREINDAFPQIVVVRISAKRDLQSVTRIKESIQLAYKDAHIRYFDDEGSISHARRTQTVVRDKRFLMFSDPASFIPVRFILRKRIPPDSVEQRRLNEVPIRQV